MNRILTGASVAVLSFALAGGAFAQARRVAPARPAATAPAAAAPAAPNVTHGPPITGVCIFSQQSAVGVSAAGRAANTRLQQLAAQVKAELQPRETSLQTDIRTFQTQRATLSADARTKQEQALSARAQELQTLERTRTQQLEQTRAKAIGQISDRLTPIVQQVYQGRGCSMLLNGDSAVFVANPAMDVTPQVVQQLNTQLPTLSFDLSPPAPAGAQ